MRKASLNFNRVTLCAASILGMALAVGCGGGTADKTPRYQATGKVLLEGAPVDGAVVAFSREDGQATAVAMTDDTGEFQLNVPPGKRGVPAGKYRVTIRKSTVTPTNKEPTTFAEMEANSGWWSAAGTTSAKLGVPARYGDPTTSELAEEITASGKNEFVIQLKG